MIKNEIIFFFFEQITSMASELGYQLFFLYVCLFHFIAFFSWYKFLRRWERQHPGFCGLLSIWWRGFNWYWSFWCFTNLVGLLALTFLWANELRWDTAFPWASSNPTFLPAPTPVSFAKFIIAQSLALTTVGPPLHTLFAEIGVDKRIKVKKWKLLRITYLMRKGIRHSSLSFNCCFFSLIYPCKNFIHCFRATTPVHLTLTNYN